ncbi:CKLF-like MARVEL transmembrane domain-containing protein 4 [Vespula maculifrons]|uniref:CKLF-like MARVEL transmembrane domain-containing protein 4 n=1 Tax=Vespula maculifrons TaxID=7453 RepID=A0ABD2AVK7_VESMC
MMSETVVTMDNSSNNASNNPRQVPTVKTEPGQPSPLAGIRLNVPYFRTIPGIIKLVQLKYDERAWVEEIRAVYTVMLNLQQHNRVTSKSPSWSRLTFLQRRNPNSCIPLVELVRYTGWTGSYYSQSLVAMINENLDGGWVTSSPSRVTRSLSSINSSLPHYLSSLVTAMCTLLKIRAMQFTRHGGVKRVILVSTLCPKNECIAVQQVMHHYNCPQAVYAEGRAAPRLWLAMQLCLMVL